MKKMKYGFVIFALLVEGCVSTTRYTHFVAAYNCAPEILQDLRLVRCKQTGGSTSIGGYSYWIDASLRDVNAFHARIGKGVDLASMSATFGAIGHQPETLSIVGTNDWQGVLMQMASPRLLNEKDFYQLRVTLKMNGTNFVFSCVGNIEESVNREILMIPLPNRGFSKAMR